MACFVMWITTFLLCAGYMFPYELKSARNDVAAQKVSESSITINPNLINKDLLSTEKDTSTSSRELKRSLRDNGNHWFNAGKLNDRKPIGNVNRQRSRRGDQEHNNFSSGVYNKHKSLKHLAERRNEDSSEMSQCSIFPARDIGEPCRSLMECPGSAVCKNFKCVCLPNYVYKDNECQFVAAWKNGEDYPSVPKGAKCSLPEMLCTCPSQYIITLKGCLPKVNVGSNCQYSQQCPKGYECNNGTCNSVHGYARRAEECLEGRRDRCYDDADCQKLIVNGYCNISLHGNFCSCPNSYIHNFLECLPKVNLGDICKDSLQCPRNSVCDYGTCACDYGYITNERECVKEGRNQCYNDEDCLRNHLNNSYCVEDVAGNLCLCPAGYVASRTECLPYVKLGGTCKLSLQCLSNSVCINDTCTCRSDYIQEGLECVKQEINQCYNDEDCWRNHLINSYCVEDAAGNFCECPSGYIASKTECLPYAHLGTCSEYTGCPEYSECRNGFCVCVEGYNQEKFKCVWAHMGKCSEYTGCPEYSDCRNGFCVCVEGYNQENFTCVWEKRNQCYNDEDCWRNHLNNSYCVKDVTGNLCQCPAGYFVSKTECLPYVKLGGTCKLSLQCLSNSVCINDTCTCRGDFIQEGLACVKPHLGKCYEYTGCPEYSECRNGFCVCVEGYTQENFTCVLERTNQCYNDADCSRNHLKNSYCVQNVTGNLCQCPDGYVASKNGCLPYVKLGGTCKLSLQCSSNSVCFNDNCTCKEGYIEEGVACVKQNLRKCSEYNKWCPEDSECRNGFCVCVEGYINGRFGCEREIHQDCYNDNDCQEKYYLEKGVITCLIGFLPYYENICECPYGYALGKNGCLLKKKLGELCNEAAECPFPTRCINGTCGCDDKYYIIKNGDCTGRTVGDPCHAGSYCSDYSDCINDTCTCQDHYVNMGDFCKHSCIGDPCTETRECPEVLGVCRNGRCVCNDSYETDIERRTCVAQFVGGLCYSEQECPSWGMCSFGRCVCANNFVEEGQVCVRETGTPGWVWGLIAGAVAVVIMSIVLLIFRWRRKQKRRPLPTVSAAVDAKFPRHSTSLYQENALKPLLNQILHPQQQRK